MKYFYVVNKKSKVCLGKFNTRSAAEKFRIDNKLRDCTEICHMDVAKKRDCGEAY